MVSSLRVLRRKSCSANTSLHYNLPAFRLSHLKDRQVRITLLNGINSGFKGLKIYGIRNSREHGQLGYPLNLLRVLYIILLHSSLTIAYVLDIHFKFVR